MHSRIDGSICPAVYQQHQFLFFVANKDDEIQHHHYVGKLYETEELELIASHLKPGETIVDVGSNIGNHAIFFEKVLGAGKVIAIEPNPTAIDLLNINLLLNQSRVVDTRHLGVGLGKVTSNASLVQRFPNNLGLVEMNADPDGAVRVVAGSELLADEAIDFIKIDVEGMELEVLSGLKAVIMRQRPAIFIEVRDVNQSEFRVMVDELDYTVVAQHRRYKILENFMLLPRGGRPDRVSPSVAANEHVHAAPTAAPVNMDGRMPQLKDVFASLGIDKNYSTMDFSGIEEDLQGWGSSHPIFDQVFGLSKPGLVVEVGSWKGASVINMANIAKKLDLDTQFICVDTWLGSNDTLWINPQLRANLLLQQGYPSMFRQFVFNVQKSGHLERIFPLPMTSSSAFYLLKKLKIQPDVIYIDAGHEEDEVLIDLKLYYDLLKPGGYMFGDDYVAGWMGVVNAVNRFSAENEVVLQVAASKWMFRKPESSANLK